MAGSWLIASVCMLRMKHMSSTILAVYGSSSLTHMPHLPCWANLYFDGAIGKPLLAARSSWSAAGPCGPSRAGPCRTTPASSACSRTDPSAAARRPCAGRSRAWPWPRKCVAPESAAPSAQPCSSPPAAGSAPPSSEASAAVPRHWPPRLKNWRRVSRANPFFEQRVHDAPSPAESADVDRERLPLTCSALRPGSSIHWPTSSRRPASPTSSAGVGLRFADGDQLLRVVGVLLW